MRQIAHEWDAVAALRAEQIESHSDLSFHLVLLPEVERLAVAADWSHVLDAGCGTGFLTERLAGRAREIVGIDISGESISLARTRHSSPNARYVRSSLERFARPEHRRSFSLVVANMTLMTVPNLKRFISSVAKLLRDDGVFVFTLTHPWFWPSYWGYEKAPWFDYSREIAIEAPFRISLQKSSLVTTHFHRPLAHYLDALMDAGLALTKLAEPLPTPRDRERYPADWRFPRFLAGRAVSSSDAHA